MALLRPINAVAQDERRLLIVHGFQYDPAAAAGDPDNPWTFFFPWMQLHAGSHAIGYGWYSSPAGPRHVWRAWRRGPKGIHMLVPGVARYYYAWVLAAEAGDVLRDLIVAYDGSIDIVCHSLGARVICRALCVAKRLDVGRVIVLSGAEHVPAARRAARAQPHVRFLNVACRSDDVLGLLGGLFSPAPLYKETIGHCGLGQPAPQNWDEIFLDEGGQDQAWLKSLGFTVRGDNPRDIGDHKESYLFEKNWDVYNAWRWGELDQAFAARYKG